MSCDTSLCLCWNPCSVPTRQTCTTFPPAKTQYSPSFSAPAAAQMDANPEIREAAQQEMGVVSHQMIALLRSHRVSYPRMLLSMFGQFPVFVSLFLATREVSGSGRCAP